MGKNSSIPLSMKLQTGDVFKNLEQNVAQSTHAESAHNWCSKDATQAQQQRPESRTVTLTWHVCKLIQST